MVVPPAAETVTLRLHDQTVEVRVPQGFATEVESLFPRRLITSGVGQTCISIVETKDGYTIDCGNGQSEVGVPRVRMPLRLLEEVTRALITRLDTAIAFHAAAVCCNETAIMMPGRSGSGKSSLAAWLLDNGFRYLTDEVAILVTSDSILGFPRALVIKPGAAEIVPTFLSFKRSRLECGLHVLGLPAEDNIDSRAHPVGLILFPTYEAGAEVKIEALTEGETGLKLIACNLNARNLKTGGFGAIAKLSRATPAVAFRYGNFDQLKGALDVLIRLVVDNQFTASEMRRFLVCFASPKRLTPVSARNVSTAKLENTKKAVGGSRSTAPLAPQRLLRDTKGREAQTKAGRMITVTGYVVGEHWPVIRPAPLERAWMECTDQRFAYRCLPLNIANGHGWEILCSAGFSAVWDGRAGLDSVTIQSDDGTSAPASSHFGRGVLTFSVPCLFRTNPGVDLMVQGPVNRPKDAIVALTGCVEADWTPFTFTMNWLFTRAGVRVRFEKGEPYCHIFPVRRGELEAIAPVLRPLSDNRELCEQYETWAASRVRFNTDLKQPGSIARSEKYQRYYHQGLDADKVPQTLEGHRTRLRLRPFSKR